MGRFYLFVIGLLAALLVIEAKPVSFLDALVDSSEDQFLLRLVDYFNGDYYDESVDSEPANVPARRSRQGRPENCKLPMKRGMCRALIPRWR
jgi:hypothetical protein